MPKTIIKKITKRQWIYIASAVAICVCGFWIYKLLFPGAFMYAGTLESTNVILTSHVASDVEKIFVAEGDTVAPGDALMELTCDTQKIMAAQIDNDYKRVVELQKRDHASQAELDAAAARKNTNDLQLKWCHVTSPINGIITTTFREVGEIVAPGTTLIAVSNPADIWTYFYVPHDMLYKLSVGQRVIGILPEAGNMKFDGRIIKINENAEFTPKNVQTRAERTRLVYGIKVKFDNSKNILKPGMTIESDLKNADK